MSAAEEDLEGHALLAGDAAAAQRWLKTVNRKAITLASDFNWHGFAEVAAGNAQRAADRGDVSDADAWAHISMTIYDQLAEHADDSLTFECAARHVQVVMINSFGSTDGHPVRTWSHVTRWFLDGIGPAAPDEIAQTARDLRQLPSEQWQARFDLVRELRKLKNRINVFRWLDPATLPPELRPWLSVWELLP